MKEIELGDVQAVFADIIWANEPIGSGELVILTSRNFTTQKCSEPRTSRFSLVLCSILIAAHKVI